MWSEMRLEVIHGGRFPFLRGLTLLGWRLVRAPFVLRWDGMKCASLISAFVGSARLRKPVVVLLPQGRV